ncbi:LOW QUALITY PROTEIN: Histidine phosphatase superfamily, clade-1 [Dillenia turbinata]|uniref:Histidine phosphatase superfamily, clade-1 n=1 Tax=Dillenia turbinata TaxID=194707 RepID=A0AAN8VZ63_9MAGN
MLIHDNFDVCFSSLLNRSKRTAEIIWGTPKEDMVTDFDLGEIDLYSFQGLLKHEGNSKFGAANHQWQVDAANFNIWSLSSQGIAGLSTNWTKILTHESKSVLMVAHNAVNQAVVAMALSNCGVSVLDFTPRPNGSPYICLNRLIEARISTLGVGPIPRPSSPVSAGSSGGRKTSKWIILVCHGSSQMNRDIWKLGLELFMEILGNLTVCFKLHMIISFPAGQNSLSGDKPMNILRVGLKKTAELLLDLKVNRIISIPKTASVETPVAISKVQEAADYLGADCVPVDMKQLQDLDVENIFQLSQKARILDLAFICWG